MSNEHNIVGVFPTHDEAEAAIVTLQKAGLDMHKFSIIGKDYHTREHVRGFLSWKDTAKAGAVETGYWGGFFGGFFGILVGAGVLFFPGVGPVIIAGPIAGVLAGWIEGLVLGAAGGAAVGGLLGALTGLGIPKEKALKYESDLQAGKFMLFYSGPETDLRKAQEILQTEGVAHESEVVGASA